MNSRKRRIWDSSCESEIGYLYLSVLKDLRQLPKNYGFEVNPKSKSIVEHDSCGSLEENLAQRTFLSLNQCMNTFHPLL